MSWTWVIVLAAVVAGVFLLDRLALWAERRGWIYWRRKKSRFVGAGVMFSTAADLFQPNRTVYVQEMERKRIERVQTPSPDGPRPDSVDL